MADALDPKAKKLAGITATVAGHCQPCFAFHCKEALRLGVSMEGIRQVVDLARATRGVGDRHTDEYVNHRLSEVRAAEDRFAGSA
ncbi:MAG: carboxymuconolactone decarboxylase family protein [Bryobacteraceae bacterium]